MSVKVTLRDETAAGTVYHEIPLQLGSEQVTVRELIRERVYQEVADFNQQRHQRVFRGLVQPTDTERLLNGHASEFEFPQHREINWKIQFARALEAFERREFLILVGDRQADQLDELFTVDTGTQISFVKLTLLVGG